MNKNEINKITNNYVSKSKGVNCIKFLNSIVKGKK